MPKKYFPIHVHTHFSLLDGLSKPSDIADRCEEIGVDGACIMDHGSMSGHIQFLDKMGKKGLKPLLGCNINVCKERATTQLERNSFSSEQPVIAKNNDGWRDLVQLVSKTNAPEIYYQKPRADRSILETHCSSGNLLGYTGGVNSILANSFYDEYGNLSSSWKEKGLKVTRDLSDIFGKDNFYLAVEAFDPKDKKQQQIAECVRWISKSTGIKCVASPNSHYCKSSDAQDHRIIICSSLGSTIQQASKPEFGVDHFFKSRQYHLPSYEEMKEWHLEEELDNTLELESKIAKYTNILRPPILPAFQCPNGQSPDQYLRHLCKEGWRQKIVGVVPTYRHQEYGDRVKRELQVLQDAGLSSYFLIVADIIEFVRQNHWLPGVGRGSAAGSLVSYLLGITGIDPILYGLLFERFYNAGRNTAERISMPDIDMDVPKYSREYVIQYIRDKYGEEYVGQMVTFTTMKGRGAIKDVLRAYGGISFEEMNSITKNIIEDHKISDELQKMKEERGEAKIIQWCLENTPEKLEAWCRVDSEGNLTGPMAERFAMAMRLEGTKTYQSKHAAGIVIAPEPLSKMCPMVLDCETGKQFAGLEMEDLESVGGIKFDVLGITGLDKSMGIQQDLAFGEIHEISGTIIKQPIYNR